MKKRRRKKKQVFYWKYLQKVIFPDTFVLTLHFMAQHKKCWSSAEAKKWFMKSCWHKMFCIHDTEFVISKAWEFWWKTVTYLFFLVFIVHIFFCFFVVPFYKYEDAGILKWKWKKINTTQHNRNNMMVLQGEKKETTTTSSAL